ncbi:MAG: thiamine biosynthesis protein ThiS [Candidatus Pelagibacter sp.]|nr:thiamine biosynthesis protein ThiS [Candidatus Pelagibacter sp.]|tara:strand:+ start:91 stop:309 length:219 start_codon:yes stop_codon:yes gene_type:complete
MINKNKIKIKANGKLLSIENNCSIKILLKKLKIPFKMVAIELNGKIIDKNKVGSIKLKEKDKLEIVHFIGGG